MPNLILHFKIGKNNFFFIKSSSCRVKIPFKMVYPYKKSNFEVLIFGGFDTSRDAEDNSKTNGEGISSFGLTVFELWPNNCQF